jgi:putative FmdB family regulatory protein
MSPAGCIKPANIMPTYDYVCTKCGHELEVFQSMKDEPLKKCPKCKKQGLKRLLGGGAGLIFKGSGFYITDYKKKSASPEGGKSSEGGKSESTSAKSETKAAAK